jgi:hypothetical protein
MEGKGKKEDMKQSLEANAGQLLTDVSSIIKGYEEQWRKTGAKYNIFKVAGIDYDEKVMCRVLADLMDPHGRHCQGSRYLRLFLDTLPQKLKDNLSLDVDSTKVTTEYVIDAARRIDIVLYDGKIFVPIEVKILAKDLHNQVHDYFEYAKKQNKGVHVPLIYLTVDGHEPPDFSKGDMVKDDYVTISFKDEILEWLEACEREIKESKEKTAVPIRENLKQLIAAIKSLCGKLEDAEMEDKIFKLVIKNDDTVRAAQAICCALDFDNKAREAFKEQILPLVKNEFKEAIPDSERGGWYYIRIPIREGHYFLDVNYDWKSFSVVRAKKERDRQLEKCMAEKMVEFTRHKTEKNGPHIFDLWRKGCYDGLADDDLYLYRLYKVYTERPQEVAKKIIDMANALEKLEA